MSIDKIFWENTAAIQRKMNLTDREIDQVLPQLWNGQNTFAQMKERENLPSGIMIDWIAEILKINDYTVFFKPVN